MKQILRFSSLIIIAGCLTGCMTRDPDTGEEVYDAEATEAIVAAFRGAAAQGVREVVVKNPDLAEYFREASEAICQMRDAGEVSPDAVLARLDALAKEKGLLDDQWLFTGKNVLVTIYRVQYARRFKVAMEPDEWPVHLLTVLCEGMRDGVSGLPPEPPLPPT